MRNMTPKAWAETDTADNAKATATRADPGVASHYITSIAGGYDATVSGATLVLKEGTTEIGRWIVYDSFSLPFAFPIHVSEAAQLELEASGTGGVTGACTLTGFTL